MGVLCHPQLLGGECTLDLILLVWLSSKGYGEGYGSPVKHLQLLSDCAEGQLFRLAFKA